MDIDSHKIFLESGGKKFRLMKAQALGDGASLDFTRGRRILEAACKNAPDADSSNAEVVEPSEVRHENENDPWTTD
ncbi:hypothetical protein K1719_027882 [Acacia pycnantha]|nr:hypothetical protein K1719_027882 [Acacia pycnantha]